MKDIHLKNFEGRSFLGIDSDNPVVIDFTRARKNGVTKLKGNQGTNKSSTIMALMSLMGAAFNFDLKHFVNRKDDTIDASLSFVYDGAEHEVIQSGTRVALKRHYKETDKWIPEGTPKETLRRIFGNLGVSPMFLKDLAGKKQIEWFKQTFSNEDTSTRENKLLKQLAEVLDQRKEVNRAAKLLQATLEASPLYQNYEATAKKFATKIDAQAERAKLDALRESMTQYNRVCSTLDQLRSDVKYEEGRVEAARRALEEAEERLGNKKKQVAASEKHIAENKSIQKEFNAANDAWINIAKHLNEQNEWKYLQGKEKEYNEMLDASQQADGSVDKLRKELLSITSTYLPKIKGLTIKVKDGLDDEDEGIFYQGKSLAQLSESELWDLFLEIWEDKGVQFIFCENINALGSQAVATMNRLVKEHKAQIFATEVDRTKNTMEISFNTKIE